MDPISITAAALVVKALDEFASEAGKRAWAGLGKVVTFIRSRFAGDAEAAAVLADVEQAPQVQERVDALAATIDRHVAADAEFHAALSALVREAEQDPSVGTFVTTVSGNAEVGKLVNIAEVRGDVNF